MAIAVGQTFSTFADLESKIEEYKAGNYVDLYMRNSRTVGAAKSRTSVALKPELVYYEVKYACVHGGRKFSSRGTGKRETK